MEAIRRALGTQPVIEEERDPMTGVPHGVRDTLVTVPVRIGERRDLMSERAGEDRMGSFDLGADRLRCRRSTGTGA